MSKKVSVWKDGELVTTCNDAKEARNYIEFLAMMECNWASHLELRLVENSKPIRKLQHAPTAVEEMRAALEYLQKGKKGLYLELGYSAECDMANVEERLRCLLCSIKSLELDIDYISGLSDYQINIG
jgi:hypothetical protein